jgi:hypothetical protein
MKPNTILFCSDSHTWGDNPATRDRHPLDGIHIGLDENRKLGQAVAAQT